MSSPVYFSRRPYKVTYYKDGEKHVINRRPPPVQHEMLPRDEVSLKTKKNDDYDVGDEFTVKHINPRHPNTIQIKDDEGKATFVSYADLNLDRKVGRRNGVEALEIPENNRYLLWP